MQASAFKDKTFWWKLYDWT